MSGKQAKKTRHALAGKSAKAGLLPTKLSGLTVPKKPELALPTPTIRLDLACGQSCKDGFEGVDIPGIKTYLGDELATLRAKVGRTGDEETRIVTLEKAVKTVKHEVDLTKFPWPWADSSVIELNCSHFAEHLPMIYVDARGTEVPMGMPGARDLFFAFFDECWRIMAPGAWMTVVVPCLRNSRSFQDPTHRRFYPAETFFYLFRDFRTVNRLDHYNVKCAFEGTVDPTVMLDMNARAPEVQQRMMNENWNTVVDWVVRIKAVKPGPQLASPPLAPGLALPSPTQ